MNGTSPVFKGHTRVKKQPSSWVLASLSTPLSPGCAPRPAPLAFESHVQSEGGTSRSESTTWVTWAFMLVCVV